MSGYVENISKGETRISIRFIFDLLTAIRTLATQHERPFNRDVL